MKKLYHTLNKISNIICKILTVLVIGVVLVNFGSVLLQVLNRYVIVKVSDISFHWTEEMARYSMIWMCYMAIPIVYREGNMAQLDLIYSRLGKKPKPCFISLHESCAWCLSSWQSILESGSSGPE